MRSLKTKLKENQKLKLRRDNEGQDYKGSFVGEVSLNSS
jgi:hypothetical protein